jgi:hypothetical protein
MIMQEKEKLYQVIAKLKSFKENLEKIDYTHQREKFFHLMQDFRSYLASLDDEELFKTFWHSKYYDEYQKFFTLQNSYYIRAIESVEAFTLMTKKISHNEKIVNFLDREFIKDRYQRKLDEIALLDLENKKNLAMIGSGPMPETIVFIAENTNISEIIGIDYNQEAIYIGGELINALNIDNVKLVHENAVNFDYSKVDAVHMAIFVAPKNKILKRIVETAPDDVQISVESPVGFLRMLYDEVLPDLHRRLKIIKRETYKNPYMHSELFLFNKHNI